VYNGIHLRTDRIIFSQEFCERYIKANKFVTPKWNAAEEILELTFYPMPNDASFRLPLMFREGFNTLMASAKFCSLLRLFKMIRYNVSDVDLDRSGVMTFKFRLEKK
jgi:hypothetical protein